MNIISCRDMIAAGVRFFHVGIVARGPTFPAQRWIESGSPAKAQKLKNKAAKEKGRLFLMVS